MSGCRVILPTGQVIEIPPEIENGTPEAKAAYEARVAAAPPPKELTDE